MAHLLKILNYYWWVLFSPPNKKYLRDGWYHGWYEDYRGSQDLHSHGKLGKDSEERHSKKIWGNLSFEMINSTLSLMA